MGIERTEMLHTMLDLRNVARPRQHMSLKHSKSRPCQLRLDPDLLRSRMMEVRKVSALILLG